MLLMFNAVFSWAKLPMDGIEAAVAWLSGTIEASLPDGPLRSLLVDGIIGGIGAVVIFLPQIFILFLILTGLEECGYLARAAYLMDRLMVRVGLCGKSFIPLLSSFACAIPGVMATRVIENRRDRLTTILIAPLMSCSARLPVYTLMIAAFIPDRRFLGGLLGLQGLTLFSMYLVGIVVAAAVALVLKRTLLRGAAPPFVMEMPGYKWPSPRVVLHRMFDRGWDFLHNAGTIIFAVSIVMWGALYYPRMSPGELAPFAAEEARLERELGAAKAAGDAAKVEAAGASLADLANRREGAQKRQSLLGRVGPADRAGRDAAGLGLADRQRRDRLVPGPRGRGGDPGRDLRRGQGRRGGRRLRAARLRPPLGHLARQRPSPLQHPRRPLDHGLLRPLCPVRLHPGRHRPRDRELDLADVHVRLHDGPGVRRGVSHVSGRDVDRRLTFLCCEASRR